MSKINLYEFKIAKLTQWFILTMFSILIVTFFLSGLLGLYINKKNIEIISNYQIFKQFEELMDKNYLIANKIKPKVQELLMLNFSEGNKKVHIGKDNYLFFKEDTQTLINKTHCKNVEIIKKNFEGLNTFLKKQEVEFFLGILPTKSQILHHMFSNNYSLPTQKYKGCYNSISLNLKEKGLMTFNVEEFYQNLENNNIFLKYDTHWTFDTMEEFSKFIANTIINKSKNLKINHINFIKNKFKIENHGDLYDMLDINVNLNMQEVKINQIKSKNYSKIINDINSDITLIGDSFTNIYSDKALKWGSNSGLAYQLAYRLKGSINSIAINGSAFKTALIKNFLKAKKLKKKSILVLIISERELRNINEEIDFDKLVLETKHLKTFNNLETILITKESEFTNNFTPYKNVLIVHEAIHNNEKILVVTWAIKNRKKYPQLKLDDEIKAQLIPFSNKIKDNTKLSTYMMIDQTNNFESEMYWLETFNLN